MGEEPTADDRQRSYPGYGFYEVPAQISLDPSRPEGTVTFFSTHIGAPWSQSPAGWVAGVPDFSNAAADDSDFHVVMRKGRASSAR